MSTFLYLDGRLASHPDITPAGAGSLVFRNHPTVKVKHDEEGHLVYKIRDETPEAECIPLVLKPYVQFIRMYREMENPHNLPPGYYHHGDSEAVLESDATDNEEDQDCLGVVIQGTDMAEMETLFQMLLAGSVQPTPRREVRRRQTVGGSSLFRSSLFSNPPPQPEEPKTGPLGRPKDLSVQFLPPGKLNKPGRK